MSKPIRPQPLPSTGQKVSNQSTTQRVRAKPEAPPIYRPQSTPKVLQKKSSPSQPPSYGARRVPTAPPVYHPQTPAVLQTKGAASQQSRASQARHQPPKPPPVYRPESKKVVQPKVALQPRKPPKAPPAYRPAPQSPTTVQAKRSVPGPSGAAPKALAQGTNPLRKTPAANAGRQVAPPRQLPVPRRPTAPTQRGAAHEHGLTTPPSARQGVVQRLSIVLQPEDSVVKKSVAYSQQVLGINDVPVASFEDANGQVGESENIYLYGHGGSSDITLEEHDLFARMDTGTIAGQLANNVQFPKNYRGTIYLIGCKTDSLVGSLKSQLDELTDLDLDVRGTTDKLQVTDDGIVLRDQPQDAKTAKLREQVDMVRRYYDDLVALKNLRLESFKALKAAEDFEGRKKVILNIYSTRHRINQKLGEVNQGLVQLANATSMKLIGRREGLEELRTIYQRVKDAQDSFANSTEDFITLFQNKSLEKDEQSRQEKIIVRQMLTTLREDKEALSLDIGATAYLINMYDSPDFLASRPFKLSQMTGPNGGQSSSGLTETQPLIIHQVVHQPARGNNSCWPSCCCCFLTTACVEARGLPDDCEELIVLRDFRDSYMMESAARREMVARYYDIAPRVVGAIKEGASPGEELESIYQTIAACVKLIKSRDFEEALQLYKSLVEALADKYLTLTRLPDVS